MKWYKRAASNDNAMAIYQLGCCYYFGHGIQKDEEEAIKCFQRGMELGNKMAEITLSKILQKGEELCFDDVSLLSTKC